jgi:hypothetical protein
MKKTIIGVAVVALAVVAMTPSASAVCAGPRTAGTYNFQTLVAAYWHSPSGDAAGNLDGQAWQIGAPGTFNTTNAALPCVGMLYFAPGGIGLGADFSTCGTGCPTSGTTIAVLAQKIDPTGVVDFLVASVVETPTGVVNFDYSPQGDHAMIRLPAPNVLSSGPRNVNSVPLTVQVPAVTAGFYGPSGASMISGYRIVSALSVGDPGRLGNAYALVPGGGISVTGGAASPATPVTLDCTDPTNTKDQWVATQLVFEGGAVLSDTVSAPKRVHCAGSLADPKYKVVPKKTTTVGAIKN